MKPMKLDKVSRKIAYLLRHAPDFTDEHGYVDTQALIKAVRETYPNFTKELLDEIVRTDEKGRYSYDETGQRIRANQGHSVWVDVGLVEQEPPAVLYHGTATRFLDSIFREGLTGQTRLYVHLSKDEETAMKVGARHGEPIVLKVQAGEMRKDGYVFYCSENGVWLTKTVPAQYLIMES